VLFLIAFDPVLSSRYYEVSSNPRKIIAEIQETEKMEDDRLRAEDMEREKDVRSVLFFPSYSRLGIDAEERGWREVHEAALRPGRFRGRVPEAGGLGRLL
jgi:hypothetical protein